MENLDLRKAVAEVLGCKAVLRTINDLAGKDNTYLFCECEGEKRFNSHSEWVNGKFLIKPYDLDRHAALDALIEFCEKGDGKRKYSFEIHQTTFGWYRIILKYRILRDFIIEEVNEQFAPAICKAIKAAAEGK